MISWEQLEREQVYEKLRQHQRDNNADEIIKALYYAEKPHRRPRRKKKTNNKD